MASSDQNMMDAILTTIKNERFENVHDGPMSSGFSATLKLLATLATRRSDPTIGLLMDNSELIEWLIKIMPHFVEDDPQDYIQSTLRVFRCLLREETVSESFVKKYPHLGNIIVSRLSRKGDADEIHNEALACLRNLTRH